MFIKTNIPETTRSLVGACVDFEDRMFDRLSLNDRTSQIQAIASGNRCGHVPSAPRFFIPPAHHKPRPAVLDFAINKLKEAYEKAKQHINKLCTTHADGRQVRSEGRESITSVGQVIFHYLELATMQVGFFIGDKFLHLDLKYIAKKAGLSVSRAKRAINRLEKDGYLEVTRQYKKQEDGTVVASASIRRVNANFLIDLGVDVRDLFFAREWKRKKEEKAQAKAALKKLNGIIHAATSFGGHIISSNTTKRQHDPSINKAIISKVLELHKADPSRSPSEYHKELLRLKE